MRNHKTKTAMLSILLVFRDDEQVGTGWVIWQEAKPVLIGNDGNMLPHGWYNLRAINEHLVVTNRSIH